MVVFGVLEILAAETAVAVVVEAFAVVVVEYSDDSREQKVFTLVQALTLETRNVSASPAFTIVDGMFSEEF